MPRDINIAVPQASDNTSAGMPAATLASTVPNASPFLLKVDDVEGLAQSDGFTILRHHLAQHYTYE